MSARIELCLFDFLEDSTVSEDALKIFFYKITENIKPININRRFEVEYYPKHLFALHLIVVNPNSGAQLKVRCFTEMVRLHNRLLSIRETIKEINNEVVKFENSPPEIKPLVKGEVRTNSSATWRAYRAEANRIKLMKVCVQNFNQAFSDITASLIICENKLPNTPEAQLLKLLR